MWAVPPPRHGRGHGPSLPWLPTNGSRLATLREANTKFGMALVQQVKKTKQQADDISLLTEHTNSTIVTPPVAQPALSAAATAPAQPTPEMMQQV